MSNRGSRVHAKEVARVELGDRQEARGAGLGVNWCVPGPEGLDLRGRDTVRALDPGADIAE